MASGTAVCSVVGFNDAEQKRTAGSFLGMHSSQPGTVNALRCFDVKIQQNPDREQPAPNAFVVDDNNRAWKILRGNGHQYAPDALQALGFAVVATPEQDQTRSGRSSQREEPGEVQVGRNYDTLAIQRY
jgi:hypothetical protein